MILNCNKKIVENIVIWSLCAGCMVIFAMNFLTPVNCYSGQDNLTHCIRYIDTSQVFLSLAWAVFWAGLVTLVCSYTSYHYSVFSIMLALPIVQLNPFLEPYLRPLVYLYRTFPMIILTLVSWATFYPVFQTETWNRFFKNYRYYNCKTLSVFILAGAFTSAFWVFPHLQPTGDEPHYFTIATSIVEDADLNLINQLPGYHPCWPGDWCRLHHINRISDSYLLSIHSPGLPVLITIPFALAGRWGAMSVMAVILLAVAFLMYHLCRIVSGASAAMWTTLYCCLGSPLLFFSFQFYPELPAAMMILSIVSLSLTVPKERTYVFAAVSTAFLPWLHVKYALIAFLGGIYIGWKLRSRLRFLAVIISIPGLSALVMMIWNFVNYNSILPFQAYSEYVQTTGFIETHPAYGLGFSLIDARHGLLIYGPLFVAGLAGFPRLWKIKREFSVIALTLLSGHLMIVSGHISQRWLGWSPPCRFLIPILPVLALSAAAFYHDIRKSPIACWLYTWTGIYQIAVAWFMIHNPSFIHQRNEMFREKCLGTIHFQSLFGIIQSNVNPWYLFGIALGAVLIWLTVFQILIRSAHWERLSKSRFTSMAVFMGLVSTVGLTGSITHKVSEVSQRSQYQMHQTYESLFRILESAGRSEGSHGQILHRSIDSTATFSPDNWIFNRLRNSNTSNTAPVSDSKNHIENARSLALQGRIIPAILAAEALDKEDRNRDKLLPLKLDLYRARRAWSQVEETALIMRGIEMTNPYSSRELNLIIRHSHCCRGLAYRALLEISNLTAAKREEFRQSADRHLDLCSGTPLQMVPFRAVPELEKWNIRPETK